MVDYWHKNIVDKSFEVLNQLKKHIDFIVIGGWASYLYTKAQKSKDIDIIVDYNNLFVLKSLYPTSFKKNPNLREYEIHLDMFDIDIYVPKFSDLIVPLEDILNDYNMISGFKVPKIDDLILLKVRAYANRKDSIKGYKDKIDIVSLLFSDSFNADSFKKRTIEVSKHNPKLNPSSLYLTLHDILISLGDKDFALLPIARNKCIKLKKELIKKLK